MCLFARLLSVCLSSRFHYLYSCFVSFTLPFLCVSLFASLYVCLPLFPFPLFIVSFFVSSTLPFVCVCLFASLSVCLSSRFRYLLFLSLFLSLFLFLSSAFLILCLVVSFCFSSLVSGCRFRWRSLGFVHYSARETDSLQSGSPRNSIPPSRVDLSG